MTTPTGPVIASTATGPVIASTATGPVIASTAIGPGHDGRAEVVVELLYPNGGRTWLSVGQEAITRAVDAAGVTSLNELMGQPWTALVAGLQLI